MDVKRLNEMLESVKRHLREAPLFRAGSGSSPSDPRQLSVIQHLMTDLKRSKTQSQVQTWKMHAMRAMQDFVGSDSVDVDAAASNVVDIIKNPRLGNHDDIESALGDLYDLVATYEESTRRRGHLVGGQRR